MDALPKISKPADRALQAAGLRTLQQLARKREDEIANLHGVGPKVMRLLREALADRGLRFRDSTAAGRVDAGPESEATSPKKGSRTSAARPQAPAKKAGSKLERYAALLRGVSPMNCKMPELKRSFEAAGFEDVRTVLSSGNVLFSAEASDEQQLERRAVAAMEQHLSRPFPVLVRSVDALRTILASDPYEAFELAPGSKRVVTFLRASPRPMPSLPLERDEARILVVHGREAFSAYVPNDQGPAFMRLIESTFSKDVTTRTWDTVAKLAR